MLLHSAASRGAAAAVTDGPMLRLIDNRSQNPLDGVALDAALFRAMEERGPRRTGESLRFWESERPAVIIGHLGAVSRQVREDACLADRVPIIRRISGGGAVLVAPGCLNYSLLLSLDDRPALRDVRASYRIILRAISEELQVPGLAARGIGDLAINDRKVSGSAQRRGRRVLLHHGTFLYGLDIRAVERYLKDPEHQPAYRARRSHAAFLTNASCGQDTIKAAVIRAWDAK